jgi:hypothetical protein
MVELQRLFRTLLQTPQQPGRRLPAADARQLKAALSRIGMETMQGYRQEDMSEFLQKLLELIVE